MRRVLGLILITACTRAVEQTPAPPDAGELEDVGQQPTCELGRSCNPIVIGAFPFSDERDTSLAESREIDRYSCAPTTDESGAEYWYRLELDRTGLLQITLDDTPGDSVDADVHLLETIDPASCLARNNIGFVQVVAPGTYFVVVDTWVDGAGKELAGAYRLSVDFTAATTGACAMTDRDLRMFWTACSTGVPDCFEAPGPNGALARFLKTPATGPVVKEAHLVTTDDDFGGGWPSALTDQIERHYRLSQDATGWAFARTEPWAPFGEGGSNFGQGSTGRPVPVLDEAWYITMYWRDRPAAGTRMLVRNPRNGRAVVASAGYETGPGSNAAIAGVAEEIHLHLGTAHRDELQIGFLADQSLPLGPIDCED